MFAQTRKKELIPNLLCPSIRKRCLLQLFICEIQLLLEILRVMTTFNFEKVGNLSNFNVNVNVFTKL